MSNLNLLQITGDAVVTDFRDTEGRCHIAIHLEVFNPSASATVQITDHKRYYLSPGGWVEQGPWGSTDFYGMGPSVPPLARRTFDSSPPWEVGFASHVMLDVKLSSGGDTENLIVQIPITIPAHVAWTEISGTPPPPPPPGRPDPLPFVHNHYPILMMGPVDLFPVGDGTQSWLSLEGQILNPWGDAIRLDTLSYVIEDDAGNRLTGNFPLIFRTDQLDASNTPIPVDFTRQSSTAGLFSFNHAVTISSSTARQWKWVTLTAKAATPTGAAFTRRIEIAEDARTPPALRFPLNNIPGGNWVVWNGPAHDDFTAHNDGQSERYALDLLGQKSNTTFGGGDKSDNANFYDYGVPVVAMADGVVEYAPTDNWPDGLGYKGYGVPRPGRGAWPPNIPAGGNVVVIKHDAPNRYTLYAHLQPSSHGNTRPTPGTRVAAGDQIGLLGNSGNTSEPHLHVAHFTFDTITGFHRALPMAFSNLTDLSGHALTGVLIDGAQVLVGSAPPPQTKVAVPDCVGQTEAHARSLIAAAGLTVGHVTFKPTPSGTPPSAPFFVIQQSPGARTQVNAGSAVNLTVEKDIGP
jgi:murein DD-endopeptidase MepM/ murein hydrolase activator NlpD